MSSDPGESSTLADAQDQPLGWGKNEQAHCDQQRQMKDDSTAWTAARALSSSPLLGLPYELRQRVFEYVFMDSSSEISPRQQACSPSRLFGMVGDQYKIPGPGSSTEAASNNIVQPLLLCRQIYQESRLMPFQVNRVKCPATMGSNTSATKRFLDTLKPFQRRAIQELELHLLASVTEAWSLRSILRSIAGVSETGADHGSRESGGGADVELRNEKERVDQNSEKDSDSSAGDSSLRELTLHITTRDLLLAQADSMVGLLHVLAVAPFSQDRPSTAFACAAAWVTEGLAFLCSLRKLSIVIECSVSVATQVTAAERKNFEQALIESLSGVNVTVEWRVQREMSLAMDDSEWVNFLWLHDSTIGTQALGAIEPGIARKVGFSSWTSMVS